MTPAQAAAEHAERITDEAVHFVRPRTVVFVRGDHPKHHQAFATGVLFEVAGEGFIFTAAHNVKDAEELDLYRLGLMLAQPKIARIPWRHAHWVPTPFDICVIQLQQPATDMLKELGALFVRPGDLLLRETDATFLVAGYPLEFSPRGAPPTMLTYWASQISETCQVLANGHDPRREILLTYDPDEVVKPNSAPTTLPLPHGLSGCGIWALRPLQQPAWEWSAGQIKLAAIEFASVKSEKLVRATKIRHCLTLLRHHRSDLGRALDLSLVTNGDPYPARRR